MSASLSGLTRERRAYTTLPLHDLRNPSPHVSSVYRLRRYKWRTFLNILGPSLVLGFYGFVCFHFLANPPVNKIAPLTRVDSRWTFYSWTVLSVFILDWARSALANLEATALMRAKVAPQSGMELMWHADNNWNNFLWWLRALRYNVHYGLNCMLRKKSNQISRPGGLWWALSSVTLLLFVAIPLSGLTMELTEAYVYNTKKVLIVGPTSDNFNFLMFMDLPNQIRASWRSGRPTTPSDSSILYAIKDSLDVSTTYYHDQVSHSQRERNPMIQIFAGPAVHETVVGSAWGLSANISCRTTPKGDLKLIDVHGFNQYTLRVNGEKMEKIGWVNETSSHSKGNLYSLVVAADGTWYGDSPYCDITNHDVMTLDNDTRPLTDVTTGVLEAYLWQGIDRDSGYHDRTMDQLLHHASEFISVGGIPRVVGGKKSIVPVAGFGVHCEVTSAVGTADVNPAHRTFSSFQRGSSRPSGTDQMAYPIQVQALRAIADYDSKNYRLNPRDSSSDSTWVAAHFAIGMLPDWDNTITDPALKYLDTSMIFSALTPANFTTAMYKLLGESIISLMGQGNHNATYGELYGLTAVKYLKPGIIPWRVVLIMLSIWTFVIVSASVWMAFNRRWASSLSAFEFFKFGAQHTADVNGFSSTRFEECERLRNIPGIVGTLSGEIPGGREGFIRMSDKAAMTNGMFVFDRAKSGTNTNNSR